MKTALMSACFLDGEDYFGNDRTLRTLRYIDYYLRLKDDLGFDDIFLFDNASSQTQIDIVKNHQPEVHFRRYDQSLVHGGGPFDYPYCWRALYELKNLIKQGYDKIIAIDTDGYVLKSKLAHFIRDQNEGWYSFRDEIWNFPDSAIFVLNKDAFNICLKYMEKPWEQRVGELMERSIPFTHVETQFKCGRFGESRRPVDDSMDYYGQASLNIIFQYK